MENILLTSTLLLTGVAICILAGIGTRHLLILSDNANIIKDTLKLQNKLDIMASTLSTIVIGYYEVDNNYDMSKIKTLYNEILGEDSINLLRYLYEDYNTWLEARIKEIIKLNNLGCGK